MFKGLMIIVLGMWLTVALLAGFDAPASMWCMGWISIAAVIRLWWFCQFEQCRDCGGRHRR